MNDYPPITGELRASMTTALDGETGDEVLYCDKGRFADLCDRIDAVHAGLEHENATLREQADPNKVTLQVRPFVRDDDKAAALKPLEEAAEIYGAWQSLDALLEYHRLLEQEHPETATMFKLEGEKMDLADEIADTITACVNLAHRYDIDLQVALVRVEKRNRERGRYDG